MIKVLYFFIEKLAHLILVPKFGPHPFYSIKQGFVTLFYSADPNFMPARPWAKPCDNPWADAHRDGVLVQRRQTACPRILPGNEPKKKDFSKQVLLDKFIKRNQRTSGFTFFK